MRLTISDEMKNEQRGMLRRTRISRLAFLSLVLCALFFLQDREPFRSHFWILFLAAIVIGIMGWLFILRIDSKRQAVANDAGLTTSK